MCHLSWNITVKTCLISMSDASYLLMSCAIYAELLCEDIPCQHEGASTRHVWSEQEGSSFLNKMLVWLKTSFWMEC